MHSLPTFWVELVLGQLAAFCILQNLPRVCTDRSYETTIMAHARAKQVTRNL